MEKIKRRTAAGIAAILVAAMVLGGCGQTAGSEATEEESAVTVSTKLVETGTITLTNSFIGTVSPQETVMIIPMAAGTVTETFFEVGDTVQAGDVLFKMDDEAAKLQYETAKLGVENARQTADSTRDNLINQQDSTDLQLESSRLQSQGSFESAQIGYVMSKGAYEQADKAYKDAVDNPESIKAGIRESLKQMSGMEVSGGNPALSDGIFEEKVTEQYNSALANLKSARDQTYQAYLSARSGYHIAEKALEIADDSEAMTQAQLDETIASTEDQLALSIDMAQLSAAQAQLALDMYTVTAPVSGVIESKGVEVNGVATQSAPAYTIVNNHTMTVTFQVSEDVKNTFSVGQQVTIKRGENTYPASITEVGTSVNPQSGLFQVKACVEASGKELPNGVSVKVSADTYRAENAMVIPYEAVYYENEGAYVYISVDGRAVKTPITTGIFDDDNIVVTGGLNLGDIVVTSWAPQLTDGVLLHAVSADAEETGESDDALTDGKGKNAE